MRFNSAELAVLAGPAGEHEGRLTHKPPPRTLYDTAYKERWFKLRANCLFYYRLNEFGGVEKNEPSGVFVLENCEVRREEDADAPFGFAIQWKDDPERKHLFFAQSDQSVYTWVTKIVQASYEHMRAQLITLRVQLRRRTGKDPLEHLGTPLPQRASWSQDLHHTRSLEGLHISPQPQAPRALSVPPRIVSAATTSDTKPSLPAKSPRLFKKSPIPPPRREKRIVAENGYPGESSHGVGKSGVGKSKASFRCHLKEHQPNQSSSKSVNEGQVNKPKSSFISHLNG